MKSENKIGSCESMERLVILPGMTSREHGRDRRHRAPEAEGQRGNRQVEACLYCKEKQEQEMLLPILSHGSFPINLICTIHVQGHRQLVEQSLTPRVQPRNLGSPSLHPDRISTGIPSLHQQRKGPRAQRKKDLNLKQRAKLQAWSKDKRWPLFLSWERTRLSLLTHRQFLFL